MYQVIAVFVQVISNATTIIDLPLQITALLGMSSTAFAYITGQQRKPQTGETANDALILEIRQSLTTIAAAIAAMGMAPAVSDPPALDESAEGSTAAPSISGLVTSPIPWRGNLIAPLTTMPLPAPAVERAQAVARKRRIHHPALAVCAGIGLTLTISALIGVLANTSQPGSDTYSSAFTAFSLLLILGWLIDAIAVILAFIQALTLKRWGWAAGLVLGSAAVAIITLTSASSLIALIYALWGPASTPAPTAKASLAATVSPQPLNLRTL